MERAKLVLLAAIASGLWMIVARDAVPEAHAQSGGQVQCNAWYADVLNAGPEKAVDKGREYVQPIAQWLQQTPGEPVFRTTLAKTDPLNGSVKGYIDIVCLK